MKREKAWNLIASLLFSLGLFELSNKTILVLEEKGAYNSVEYFLAILIMSFSAFWAITTFIDIYRLGVKTTSNSLT